MLSLLAEAAPQVQDVPWGIVVIGIVWMLAVTFITWAMWCRSPKKAIIVQKDDDDADGA